MPRAWLIATVLFAAVVAVAATGWARFDQENDGIPGFYLWKSVSSEAHGGQRVDIDGVRIYTETFGEGPPVLVLHGGAAFLETMHYQITDLTSDHLIVAPDSRGHGRSSDGPEPLHYAVMAEDMIGLMDRLHIAKADVVGWSDGGIIGLDLAMRHPDRIGRVVAISANFDVAGLVDPVTPIPSDGPAIAAARDFYRLVSATPDNWPAFFAKVQQMWTSEPHYSLADLGRIRAPVLVIAGENDAIRREHTDALAHAIPRARELIVPGASHMVPLENHETVDTAIRAFLAGPPP